MKEHFKNYKNSFLITFVMNYKKEKSKSQVYFWPICLRSYDAGIVSGDFWHHFRFESGNNF